jgi:cytochrome bd-type quinol oxidase subunit 2
METASKVMYKIANIFNWIEFACGIIFVVLGILLAANVIDASQLSGEAANMAQYGGGVLIAFGVYMIIVTIVLIVLVRKAYAKGSSKGWDIAFMVLGIIGGSVFYFLGGLFGLIAVNR